MTQHSKLGPSQLYRVLACPGSFKLAQDVPEGASSFYAAEGTAAHHIIEQELSETLFEQTYSPGDVIDCDGFAITVDQDMLDCVQIMITFCETLKDKAGDKVWVEQRVTLDHLWEDGPPVSIFGTVDFGAYVEENDTLYCVDYKHGRLSVTPHDNPQPMAYSLGMVHELGFVPSKIVNVIIQPRDMASKVPIRVAELAGLDLLIWANDVLVPGVIKANEAVAPLAAGDHCRFCPAKSVCPALPALAQEKARADFSQLPASPNILSDDELGDVMNWVSVLKMWIEQIQAEASQRIERGGEVPNWKLVPKRATRKWTNKDHVLAQSEHYAKKVPLSPAQLEKADSALYADLVGKGFLDMSSSGTTLVPDTDPREAFVAKKAKDDFDPT